MDLDTQRESPVTLGDSESQVTGGDIHRDSLTQAVRHRPVAHTVTHPPTDSHRHSPTQVSHSGHCALLEPPGPLGALPSPEGQAEGWQRGQHGGLAQGPAAKRGSQEEGVAKATGSCGTNQELRFLTLIFRSWAWAGWAGQRAQLPWAVPEDTDTSLSPTGGVPLGTTHASLFPHAPSILPQVTT